MRACAACRAKESKHIIEGGTDAEISFHRKSLVTQATTAAWAGEFNFAVECACKALHMPLLPRVELNRCYMVVVEGGLSPRPLFVEPLIDGCALIYRLID